MTRKDLKGYEMPFNPNRKGGGHVHWDGYCYDAGMRFNEEDCQDGGRCSKADHGPQVIDKPCPKCGFQCGGGRESGNPGSVGGAESTRAAAANPAACPDCEDFRQIVDPVPRHVHWCHERIRELEAETKRLNGVAYQNLMKYLDTEAHVKELEAEHAECPRPRPGREDG